MASTDIPARFGASAHLQPGQKLKISNPYGRSSTHGPSHRCPTAAKRKIFNFKYLSIIHTRLALGKLTLAIDDILRDNERQPMLTLLEDTYGCVHCMLFAACDKHCHRQLGTAGHDSCGDNPKMGLSKVRPCSGPLRPDISALRWLLHPKRLKGGCQTR
jgi:uncharacterized protein YcgI (DUF1989 family)